MHIFILFMREYTYKYGPTFSYGDDVRWYLKNLKKKSQNLLFEMLILQAMNRRLT